MIDHKKILNQCNQNDYILLALSGGIDSMCLLDLLYKSKLKFAAAHCNFMLRGEESNEDMKHVEFECKKRDVNLYIKCFDTLKYVESEKLNIQIAARNLRYNWFNELFEQENFTKIAIAHNLNDSIETLFINLLRGTGIEGMKGISSFKKIYRPLLNISRNEIEEYVEHNNVSFRNDSSNSKDKYLRNKIRHHIVPILENTSPNFYEIMLNNFDNFSSAASFIENHIIKIKTEILFNFDDVSLLLIDKLLQQKDVKFILFNILKDYSFKSSDCNDIYKSILNRTVSGKQFYSKTHNLLIDRKYILIENIKLEEYDVLKIEKFESEVNINYQLIDYNNFILNKYSKISISSPINYNNEILNFTNSVAYFDADKFKLPIEIKKVEKGNSFSPYGMNGKVQKISDYFNNNKINCFDKKKALVLFSNSEIAWVIGFRTSEKFKISNKTKNIIKIELLK